MNITLQVLDKDGKEYPVTFYSIAAVSLTPNGTIIHSNGEQFKSVLPYGELWDKLKYLQK